MAGVWFDEFAVGRMLHHPIRGIGTGMEHALCSASNQHDKPVAERQWSAT